MNVLIVVASRHGSTEEIANDLARTLRTSGCETDVRHADDVDTLDSYDGIIVGSAVYVGRWLGDARSFVDRHGEALRRKPVWLFSSGPLGDPPRPAEEPVDVPDLVARTAAREHRLFPGELKREGLGLGERAAVKLVQAPYGDFRPWPEIESWAKTICATLRDERVADD